jgi:hypothetical protein
MVCAETDGLLGAGEGGGGQSFGVVANGQILWATSYAYMFRPLLTILMKKYKIWQTCSRENRAYFYIMLIQNFYTQI